MTSGSKGDKNPRWNGGVSEYPDHYLLKKRRIKILEANGYKCDICGGQANVVHHKDGSKNNHAFENLQPLCYKCHRATIRSAGRPKKYAQESIEELIRISGVSYSVLKNYFLGIKIQTAYKYHLDRLLQENKIHPIKKVEKTENNACVLK